MTAELHATKTEIMDNMMAELEACFATNDQLGTALSTRPLRPGAPEFVSSLCPSVGSDTVTPPGRRPSQQKPLPFDGYSPWDAYKLQFEMLAAVNGWTGAQKAIYLPRSMPTRSCPYCVDEYLH